MDYLDCVVHIFTPEAREFYRLEHLWGEVPGPVGGLKARFRRARLIGSWGYSSVGRARDWQSRGRRFEPG